MALSSISSVNTTDSTLKITFSNPGVVDEVDFQSNVFIFKANKPYTLSKSDFAMYCSYMISFSITMSNNYPASNGALPQCEFDTKIGATALTYNQFTGSNNFCNLTYTISNKIISFAGRPNDIKVSPSEFTIFIRNL